LYFDIRLGFLDLIVKLIKTKLSTYLTDDVVHKNYGFSKRLNQSALPIGVSSQPLSEYFWTNKKRLSEISQLA